MNIDYTFLCTDMYGYLCGIVSASPIEEVEARVYCTHVPPPLQITVPSLVDKLFSPDFIDQICRSANTRMKEHKAACRLARFEGSAVAEHAWKDGHIIEWDEVKILDTAREERERRVKEALCIRLAPPGLKMDRDEGKEISPLWLCAMKRTQGRHCSQGRNATQPLTAPESHHPPPNLRTRFEPHPPPTPPSSV